jgi:exodeoxyribonuclease VII small subunit
MSKKKTDAFSYDAAMQELQKIVAQMQEEAVTIDDLVEKVSRATELIQLCKQKLHQTEEDIKALN